MQGKLYIPTRAQRERVIMLVATGMGEREIASLMKCTRDTLRKHFKDELRDGHSRFSEEIHGLLVKSARKGNVSAQKFLAERYGSRGAVAAADTVGTKAVGVKAERQAAAEEVAAGKFAPPEAPKLVVNNR